MRTHQIGGTQVDRVLEFEGFPAPATLIFPNCTADIVAAGRGWLDERFIGRDADTLMLSFHSFLVRSRGRTILVDTCHGNDKERPGMDYAHHMQTDYLQNLARAGVRPEDIDLVLCTHLHFDHIGWNTKLENGRWVPTFPKAKYLISRADYDWFAAGKVDPVLGCAFNDSVLPVMEAGQVELVDTGHVIAHELGDGIWLEGAPGHTPGSVMLHCQDRHGHAVFTGDVMHHPIQAAAPHLHIHGEADWEMALGARMRLMEQCADTDTLVFAAHFPTPTAARFVRAGNEFRVKFPE
jgi:glyoxylase-like metal-dependent hydrolase (beta-lactamase superfamily II)